MCSGSKTGSYLRLIDVCITLVSNKGGEKEEGDSLEPVQRFRGGLVFKAHRLLYHSTLGFRVEGTYWNQASPSCCPNAGSTI